MKQDVQMCALCGREVENLTRHHLIPREEGGNHGPVADLCQPCHSTVHLTFSNKELAVAYNNVAALQQAEEMQKYLKWIRKNSTEKLRNRRGRRR
ncbi:MAG: HNH endonuclease [Hymenobacteraceae bacterium]|nr:HNH endonuclease [Hymenobacteraceae bacterium]MDX5397798.1 HNH endonuclease [Hymenobacteraceae bacterium]MDX5442705.1 HNH endonuclease [Hymenobacteraceae bacterium]MDX5513877.1 HNH endonuclease [Hymenobacteraceae bacterium]